MIKEILLISALLGTPTILEDSTEEPINETANEEEETSQKTFTAEDIIGYTFSLTYEDDPSYDSLYIANATDYKLTSYTYGLNDTSETTTYKGEYSFDETIQVISLYTTDKTDIYAQYKLNLDYTMSEYTVGLVSKIKDYITDFASQYLDYNTVMTIVSLALNSGLLSAIAGIYFKYRKYKATSAEDIQKKVLEVINDNFEGLGTETLSKLVDKLNSMEKSIEIMQKALILAQDKTAEGKKALIELLSETSNSEEVKETATQVETKVIEEQKAVEKVQEEVKADYTPID